METSTITIEESSTLTEVRTFEELNLSDEVLRGICAHGWEKPSAIQRKAILPILKGNDIIAQAQSGTGKTETSLLVHYLLLIEN